MHGTQYLLPVLAGLIVVAGSAASASEAAAGPQGGEAATVEPKQDVGPKQAVGPQQDVPMSPEGQVHIGRLLSVYGRAADGKGRVLYAEHVFVAPHWHARLHGACASLPCNPDSLLKRVLIDAPIGSPEFARVLAGIVAPTAILPVTAQGDAAAAVPRNATFRVMFASEAAAKQAVAENHITLLAGGKPLATAVQYLVRGASVLCNPAVGGTAAHMLGGTEQSCLPAAVVELRVTRGPKQVSRTFDARGWLPDRDPPRIVGSMRVYLERVGKPRVGIRMLTLFMAGIEHSLDRGDVLRLHDPATGKPMAALEVIEDAMQPEGHTDRVHVFVRDSVDANGKDWLEELDPSNLPAFPHDSRVERDAFLLKNAPKVGLRALLEHGDDSSNFITVSSQVVRDTDGNRKDVAPDAKFGLRFSLPLDGSTLQRSRLVFERFDAQFVFRRFEVDANSWQFVPVMDLPTMTEVRRKELLASRKTPELWRPSFRLEVDAGEKGLCSASGIPMPHALQFGFSLDPAQ